MNLHPQHLGESDWFYAMKTHLLLVHEVRSNGAYIRTDQIKIPWRKISAVMPKVLAPKKAMIRHCKPQRA